VLEAAGHFDEAFKLYLRAKNGERVSVLLPQVVNIAEAHLSDILELCRTAKRETAAQILKVLGEHPESVRTDRLTEGLMFDWVLMDLFFTQLASPPPEVVDAYISVMAIYDRPSLQSFLDSRRDYHAHLVVEVLLKLGCLSEFGSLLRRYNIVKYLEFLVVNEDWAGLFGILKEQREKWPNVLKMMVWDRSYFLEFARHFGELGLSLSDVVAEIPPDCPAEELKEGFQYLAGVIAAANRSERILESLYRDEATNLFDDLMRRNRTGTEIHLG
jgi:hypothetical protein